MSYINSLHHIVISTYHRKMTINDYYRKDLYRYIWKIITDRKCFLCRINGIGNHVHLLVDLHQTVALADLVREIKRKTSIWMKRCGYFPLFEGWSHEYAAFSKSMSHKHTVIQYIINQQEHHRRKSFAEEIFDIYKEEGIEPPPFIKPQ